MGTLHCWSGVVLPSPPSEAWCLAPLIPSPCPSLSRACSPPGLCSLSSSTSYLRCPVPSPHFSYPDLIVTCRTSSSLASPQTSPPWRSLTSYFPLPPCFHRSTDYDSTYCVPSDIPSCYGSSMTCLSQTQEIRPLTGGA